MIWGPPSLGGRPAQAPTPSTTPEEDCAGAGTSFPGDALRAVWERHRTGVFERVSTIERAVRALAAGELDERLREQAWRAAHMLAGSLGTFGFTGASEAARELEAELEPVGPAPGRAPRMELLVAAVRRGLERERETIAGVPGPVRQPVASADDRLHVLVVDDDRALCERIAVEAAARDMRCETATSPQQARELCAEHRPTVVLLDLTFPTDGMAEAYTLLSELSAATPAVPVFVLTGTGVFADRVEAARRGSKAFLLKSLPATEVLDAVERFVARDRLAPAKVLAVDDDPAVLDTVRTLLGSSDLDVSTLAEPLRFWETLEDVAPELLILDVEMPGVNGLELCRTVRNDPRWSGLAVLFATARTDAETIERVFSAGADDYVAKPIVGPELLTRVANRLERVRLYRTLAEMDGLTGLANRGKADDGLAQLAELADRFHEPLSVGMLDLDGFKLVNDRYGHAAGDSVLRRLAERLRRDFRGIDVIGRWGGEEFVIGMYGMTRVNAVRRLTDTLERFREEEFPHEQGVFRVSFSAGVAVYPLDEHDLAAVYRTADKNLYRAKAAGRARVLASDRETMTA
jgi:diguanylate cyclase (GGDEF)-like protein